MGPAQPAARVVLLREAEGVALHAQAVRLIGSECRENGFLEGNFVIFVDFSMEMIVF